MSNDLLGTAEAVNTLNKTFNAQLDYRRFYQLVVNGRIPAVRLRNRWYVTRSDFGCIAEVLGLAPPTPTVPERPRRRKAPTRSSAPVSA